jgi:GrpB-like predicted nucleotidyltransferase (UPF0157 family)
MIALVEDLDGKAALVMERAGYKRPEKFAVGLEHRRYLCYPEEDYRTHHLHLVELSEEVDACLGFRDALRASPDVARAYVSLKEKLAAKFQADRMGYTKAKGDFIVRCLARALPPRSA